MKLLKYIILPSLLIVTILLFAFLTMNKDSKTKEITLEHKNETNLNGIIENIDKQKEELFAEPTEEVFKSSIASTGDVLVHRPVYQDAYQSDGTYDFTKLLAPVKEYMQRPGVMIANSESIIGGAEIGVSTYPNFNTPYEMGDALKDAGVDAVNMANNHTLDRGEKAVMNATAYWNKLDIVYTGAARDFEEANTIKTIEDNDITYSLLGYTYGTNGIPVPTGKEYLVNLIDLEKMESDIKRAKEVSDVVVVNLHIGNEYVTDFNSYQDETAQKLADLGVDIVFAHHAHVLQPVKWYTGVNGNKTYVIHSLGNYVSSQVEFERKTGGIFQLDVEKKVTTNYRGETEKEITISNPRMLLTYVDDNGNWDDYVVYPMYKLTNDILPNAKDKYEKMKAHMSKYETDLTFIEE